MIVPRSDKGHVSRAASRDEKRNQPKLSAIWERAFKNVRQPCSRLKAYKEYRFEWAQN